MWCSWNFSLLSMLFSPSSCASGTDWGWDGDSITKANGFLFQLQSSSFLIAFKVLLRILYVLRELTVKLQMQAIDVTYAYQQVTSVISTLK